MFYYIWAVAGRQIVLCIGKLKLFRNLISRSEMAKIYADVVQDALITSVIELPEDKNVKKLLSAQKIYHAYFTCNMWSKRCTTL